MAPKKKSPMKASRKSVKGNEQVERDICEVYSKGTIESASFEQNYVLALFSTAPSTTLCVCFFDLSTYNCHLGQFQDDPNTYSQLRTTLAQIRPSEVLTPKSMPVDIIRVIKA